MMISQDVQGGAEMWLIKYMAWAERHGESNWMQLSERFGSRDDADKSKQITIPGFLMPAEKSCEDCSVLAS